MKKKILCAVLGVLMLFALVACGTGSGDGETTTVPSTSAPAGEVTTDGQDNPTPTERTAVNLAVLAGPTGMGASYLMEQNEAGESKNAYTVTVATAPDQVTAGLINGSLDMAAIPTNLAAVLYQKTEGGVQVLACNTLGVLYLLENGDTVHSVEDLRGKTVYATGQGSTPEYIFSYILAKNGLTVGTDVTVEYLAEHAELAAKLKAGEVVLGVLPEPQVSVAMMGNADLRVALNLTEEWNRVAGDSALIQGCIAVRTAFAQEHPEAISAFLTEYEASVNYVNENPEAAAKLIEKHGIVAKEAIALRAIPNANMVCMTGAEMKTKLSGFLQVLFDADAKSVGGKLPDDGFYYGN